MINYIFFPLHRKHKLGLITNWNLSMTFADWSSVFIMEIEGCKKQCSQILFHTGYYLICSVSTQIEQRVHLLQGHSLENRIRSSPAAREAQKAELETQLVLQLIPRMTSSTQTGRGAVTDRQCCRNHIGATADLRSRVPMQRSNKKGDYYSTASNPRWIRCQLLGLNNSY